MISGLCDEGSPVINPCSIFNGVSGDNTTTGSLGFGPVHIKRESNGIKSTKDLVADFTAWRKREFFMVGEFVLI